MTTSLREGESFSLLIDQLRLLRASMIEAEQRHLAASGSPHLSQVESQRNLLHYLALRRQDLRPLQQELAMLGLSSLGRAESHVLPSIDAVLAALLRLSGKAGDTSLTESCSSGFREGNHLLEMHSCNLLGARPPHRSVRIVVTLPSEAESDYTLIQSLLQQGMEVARINCAHDSAPVWDHMIRHIRRAEKALGRSCRILMDLAGPKLRTGPVEPGPAVMKWRPERNPMGVVTRPARIWITASEAPSSSPTPADASLPVPGAWMARLRAGESVHLTDTRGARRRIRIIDTASNGCWGESSQTVYLAPGVAIARDVSRSASQDIAEVGAFPPDPGAITLFTGDTLIFTRELLPGRSATLDSSGRVLTPARIGCTLPEIFDDVLTGERVWFDDGRIGGTIERVEADRVFVRITQARVGGEKLRSDKGINLPDSSLRLPALTPKDIDDLAFVAARADMVGLSFAQSAADVQLLLEKLDLLGRKDLGIVLKVETRRGFDQLPAMLLAGMKVPSLGVMIARGDLAVESGFERMAEVQEEILWICEAAHCPVIWATQVLENLAKEGMPSRAEITDAAMGHRAEAVMLNKGPHILRAVQTLDDILKRMEAHQSKKQSMMRGLHLARSFISGLPPSDVPPLPGESRPMEARAP